VVDGSVSLRWAAYAGDDFRAYVVFARYDGESPRPESPDNVVLFRTTDPAVQGTNVRFRPDMAIRIVAIGRNDTLLAASVVLRPVAEPKSDPPTTTGTTVPIAATVQ
jgi:hypothetical protein